MKSIRNKRHVCAAAVTVMLAALSVSVRAESAGTAPIRDYGRTSGRHNHNSSVKQKVAAHGGYSHVVYNVPTYYGDSLMRPVYKNAINYSAATSGGDYLRQMGGESRWRDGKCIRVYVAPGRPGMNSVVANCFNQWTAASGHRFSWTFSSNRYQADYCIAWTTQTHVLASGDEAGLTTTDTEVDPNTDREFIDRARTRILTRYQGKTLSDSEIEKTILHEVGHGLGLEGHSSNPRDIMYYAVSSKQTGRLTTRDANTMARLYSG